MLQVAAILTFLSLALAAPAWSQVPDGSATMRAVVDDGYFERCRAGERRGCSLFVRLVALRLNSTGDPSGWGWLSKAPGETGYDGFSEDSIVWTSDPSNLRNVIDIVGGAGAPGASPVWPSTFAPRRASNEWVAPRALAAADLEYLKPGSGGGGGGGGGGTSSEHAAILARLAALEQAIAGVADVLGRWAPLLETAAAEASNAAVRASEIKSSIEALAARPVTVEFPEYRGSIGLPGWIGGSRPVTLAPVVP